VLDSQPWLHEPSLIELPWKDTVEIPQRLKIGVIYHDGVVQPHPPISRHLQGAVESLQKAGHDIVSWDTSLHRDLIATIDEAYFLDGGAEYHEILKTGNEPPMPLISWILEKGTPRLHTVNETWKVSFSLIIGHRI
jgi:amidase